LAQFSLAFGFILAEACQGIGGSGMTTLWLAIMSITCLIIANDDSYWR
jgi:hypothetical protein